MPWGVKEARNLGVEQVLLDAGAHVAPTWLQYVEGSDEPAMLPMSMMIEGLSWLATRQDITTPSSVRACRSHCGTLGSSGT